MKIGVLFDGMSALGDKPDALILESVEAEEVMLMQRLCDAEGRKVLEKINGGSAAQDNGIPFTALQANKNNAAEMKNETETLEVYGEF